MNKKGKEAIRDFYLSVLWYLKKEYKPKYYRYCDSNSQVIKNRITPLYWGGENIPNTALEIVNYIKGVSL